MKGKHVGKEPKERNKNLFPNVVVTVLLLVGILVSAAVIYDYHRMDRVVPADVLAEILGFAAAELGILAGRQAVGSDVLKYLRKKRAIPMDRKIRISLAAAYDF